MNGWVLFVGQGIDLCSRILSGVVRSLSSVIVLVYYTLGWNICHKMKNVSNVVYLVLGNVLVIYCC